MKERDLNLDLIKVVAMFAIIGLHTCHTYMSNITADIIYKSSVCAIPLFFMVSGYLMSNKPVTYQYIKKKIAGIIRFVTIISSVYLLVWVLIAHRDNIIEKAITILLGSYFQKGEFGMFWYLGSMMVIYMLMPLLLKIRNFSDRYLIRLILIGG